jgi:hypothetical protein
MMYLYDEDKTPKPPLYKVNIPMEEYKNDTNEN